MKPKKIDYSTLTNKAYLPKKIKRGRFATWTSKTRRLAKKVGKIFKGDNK